MALSDYAGTYTELEGSGESSIDRSTASGTRAFKVAWADREVFRAALLGYVIGAGDSRITMNPDVWPTNAAMLCRNVSIEPMGRVTSTSNPITYEWARVTAVYDNDVSYGRSNDDDPGQQSPGSNETLEYEGDLAAEFLNVTAADMKWKTSNVQVPLDQLPMVVVPYITISVPVFNDVRSPTDVMEGRVGCVNNATFLGRPKGYVLYLGSQFKRRKVTAIYAVATPVFGGPANVTSTQILYAYVHKFGIKTRDWGQFYNPTTGAWDFIVTKDGFYLYNEHDLTQLFPTR